ncbi:hypothetical protein Tco_1370871 [Tanacetum coccineum]
MAQMKCDTAFGIRRVTTLSEAEILHLWTQFMKPGGSLDTSEGSKNSGSFEDSGRSYEEDSKDRAFSKEGDSETPQVRRSTKESRATMVSREKNQTCSLVRISAIKKASQSLWMFRVKEEQDGSKRLVLSILAAKDLHLEKIDVKTTFLHGGLDEDIYMTQSAGKEENLVCKLKKSSDMAKFNKPKWWFPLVFEMKDRCSEKQVLSYVLTVGVTIVEDIHQVSDEREVEVLRSFNMPPSELITEDGLLPERERLFPRVPYVQRYKKVRAVALLKGRWFEVYRDYLRRIAVK